MLGAEPEQGLDGSHRVVARHTDLGGDYHARRDPERQTKRLVAQLERLGQNVTLQEATA